MVLPNRAVQPETWTTIRKSTSSSCVPLEEHFGLIDITYGFAGPELVKAIKERATEGGWLPNINPESDQHAGFANTTGSRWTSASPACRPTW